MSAEQELPILVGLRTPAVTAALERVDPPGRTVLLSDAAEVSTYAAAKPVDLLVLPAATPDEEVGEIRGALVGRSPHGQVLLLSETGEAVALNTLGPWRGVDAPPPPPADELREIVTELIEFARVGNLTGLVGESESISSVVRTVARVATTDVPVLIQGPSGTGKELVARGIHEASRRRDRPFIAVNTPGLSESLIESELFGHEKGAFTGAAGQKAGVFEAAGEGTIFLDEIGDLSRGLQSKLLRVLEQQEFQRVGGTRSIRVEARVLTATNVDLERAVAEGRFREDLYFRLKVVTIDIPPLRERPEDILPLLNHFIRTVCRARGTEFMGFTEEAAQLLIRYPWPGNVRELRNLVEHVILLHPGERVGAARLARILEERSRYANLPAPTGRTPEQAEREMIFQTLRALREELADLRETLQPKGGIAAGRRRAKALDGILDEEVLIPLGTPLAEVEEMLIRETLDRLGGDKRRTAEVLGIGLRTLYRRLEKMGDPRT